VKFLEQNEFIRLQTLDVDQGGLRYVATQLGLACLSSSLSPDEGLTVFTELQKARKCFVLENELHIIYQVVPIYAAVGWPNLDWMNYLSLWESLSSDVKRVGELVGVEERFLVRAMRGTVNTQIASQARTLAIHQRFYTGKNKIQN
jgi:DNA polymerase theta